MKNGVFYFSLISIVIFVSVFLIGADEADSALAVSAKQQQQLSVDGRHVDHLRLNRKPVPGTVARSYLEREDSSFENDTQSNPPKRSDSIKAPCNPNGDQREMLSLVNKARAIARDCGTETFKAAPSLSWNCKLYEAAFVHSQDMIDYDYFDHQGSDGSSVGVRVSRSGYDWKAVGENIAAGYPDNEQVLENLLSSPTHCENIMDAKFREFGFAVIATDQARYYNYWTQVFALH
ncbi:MAG: CAP domain-containing protein [Candidatus Thiodiazotropha sp. L084R]